MTSLKVEDADEHEIFDINDFTTASDWERFIVQIEEQIAEWKVNTSDMYTSEEANADFETGIWAQLAEQIQFDDQTFTLTYYSLKPVETSDKQVKPDDIEKPIPQTYEESSLVDFDSLGPISSSAPEQNQVDLEIQELNKQTTSSNLPPKSMADLLSKTSDFKKSLHTQDIPTPPVAYWYGISKFLIIAPTRSSKFIKDESEANLILSSVSIAINNTGCLVPFFVQVSNMEREMFIGLCEGSALKTHFQVVHFQYIPAQYAYLSGLLEIFKSKLGAHLSESNLLITISVRFTYLILENNSFIDNEDFSAQNQEQLDVETDRLLENDIETDKEALYPKIRALPFGSKQDCIESINLSCVWSNLSEDIIFDSDSFSDLNPLRSNEWTIKLRTMYEKCDMQMTNLLENFIDESRRTISVQQLIGMQSAPFNMTPSSTNDDLKQSSLDKLSSVGSSRKLNKVYDYSSNMVERASHKMKILNINSSLLPLDKKTLDFIMDFLFPDANLAATNKSNESNNTEINNHKLEEFTKRLNLMKASSVDNSGLLNKLANCMSIINEYGPTRAIAQLWKEFLLELRFRYESSCYIPGLTSSQASNQALNADSANLVPPDLSRCLLHQKLQMLNCCIKKKLERQRMEINTYLDSKQSKIEAEENSDDNDADFFDCEDDESLLNDQVVEETEQPEYNLSEPEGRLKKFGNHYLLSNPSEPIYVPMTQESTPMTEDMLEQHVSVLVNLGNGDDAALIRAKIQSASLLSDMESFKAANPTSQIEDFVRWYSPRDYSEVEEISIDEDTKKETIVKKRVLSQRMSYPGNIWLTVWAQAKPVAARRQRRLFDDTKEAENVFDWLNSLSLGQIVDQILPVLFYSAIHTSFSEAVKLELDEYLMPTFKALVDQVIKVSRNGDTEKYHDLVGYIKAIEQIVSSMRSIIQRFKQENVSTEEDDEVKGFLKHLLFETLSNHDSCEIKIPDGAHSIIGKLIKKLSKKKRSKQSKNHEEQHMNKYITNENSSDNYFDRPFKREYIMRSSVPRPAPYSRQSPQRMYCLLKDKAEFRLAGAFTEDTMFF